VRPTRAEVDPEAIGHNVRVVADACATPVCAVVKADGYGHGAVVAARAALDAGAVHLAVALVEEGVALRSAGIDAPILVLSEVHPAALPAACAAGLTPTVCSPAGVAAAAAAGVPAVHLKVDTGMHRMGCAPAEVVPLARAVLGAGIGLGGVWTHCAVADDPAEPFTGVQIARFAAALGALEAAGIDPGIRHAANSAAALVHPAARYDLVRVGIALYGVDPSAAVAGTVPLRPALRLCSEVSAVRRIDAGEGVSYGLRWRAASPTTIATVPIGYADGVRRDLGLRGGVVLHGGCRRPVAGVVTMDQLLFDAGDAPVAVGDEVVLLGRQGSEERTAAEVAAELDTIPYEVLTSLGPRIPRVVQP
jgi:alanine racemase